MKVVHPYAADEAAEKLFSRQLKEISRKLEELQTRLLSLEGVVSKMVVVECKNSTTE